MTAPLVRALQVARSYGEIEALAPTDLELVGGEIVALVGPNGAGKSTLLAIAAGALEPTQGTVETQVRVPTTGALLYVRIVTRRIRAVIPITGLRRRRKQQPLHFLVPRTREVKSPKRRKVDSNRGRDRTDTDRDTDTNTESRGKNSQAPKIGERR